jgi:uncharacterized protein
MAMKTTQAVLDLLSQALPSLQARYPIRSLALVGSYARGEQTETSDVDLVIDFNGPVGIGFIKLAHELEDIVGLRVDLISLGGIKPDYLQPIVSGAIVLEPHG